MITVVLTIVLVIFGVPEWARDRLHTMWTRFRGIRQPQPDPEVADAHNTVVAQAVGDEDTMNATAGDTEQAVTEHPDVDVRPPHRWLRVFFARPLPHSSPHVPVPHTAEQRDQILAGAGAVLENIPAEWPHDLEDEGLEQVQQMAPVVPSAQESTNDIDEVEVVQPEKHSRNNIPLKKWNTD